MDLQLWKQRLRWALARFEANSVNLLGFEVGPGENLVTDAGKAAPADLPPGLAELYREVGEVSLPDIGSGYFVHPPGYLAESVARGLPVRVETDALSGPVVTFGSEGGGTLYCMPVASGEVWELLEGEIRDGVYLGGMNTPRLIAASVEEFLDKLLADVDRFIETGQASGLS
jgi:hypothetical protein